MSQLLYVRIKGRVQGPFPMDKLKQLVRRGQLSRIHQVSEDGQAWRKASEIEELFSVTHERPSEIASASVDLATVGEMPQAEQPSSPNISNSEWWVDQGGTPQGPFQFSTLKDMFRNGKYSSNNLVWCTGMENWVAASTVEGLGDSTASSFNLEPAIARPPQQQQFASTMQTPQGGGFQPSGQNQFAGGHMQTQNYQRYESQLQQPAYAATAPTKVPDKTIAIVLALFVGWFGIHKFYLGQTGEGVAFLLLNLFLFWTLIVPLIISVVCLVNVIQYACTSEERWAEQYGS